MPTLHIGGFAIAHNGNLTNARAIHRELVMNGAIFQSTMDTEVVLQLTARSQRNRIEDRFIDALRQLDGGYAFVALTNDKLIGARDPWGLRPLVLGSRSTAAPVLCSETCALDAIGASFVRNIENGEVVVIDENGVESLTPFPTPRSDAPACSNTSTSRAPTASCTDERSTRRASASAACWRASSRSRPT